MKLTNQQKCENLLKFYDDSENNIKADALVNRAYIDKVSKQTINEKVNAQMNSIKTGIYNINPKFKEGSKNYEATKKLVSETLSNYEQALLDLSSFYDGKIEQLILRKVELESSLIGSILNEEYLNENIEKRNNQKENDSVKKSVKDNIKAVIEKIKNRRTANAEVDPKMITNLLDQQEVAIELDEQFSNNIDKIIKDKNDNKDSMEKFEQEISLINSEIDKINERKKNSIYDAMEIGGKELTPNAKKIKIFGRITRFFVSRFNTAKVVQSTIIDPLNERIEIFKVNELSSMKG